MFVDTIPNLVVFLLMSNSLVVMWLYSAIFKKIREYIKIKLPNLQKPFLCADCMSFWFGFFVAFLYDPMYNDIQNILSPVFCGLISHLVTWSIRNIWESVYYYFYDINE